MHSILRCEFFDMVFKWFNDYDSNSAKNELLEFLSYDGCVLFLRMIWPQESDLIVWSVSAKLPATSSISNGPKIVWPKIFPKNIAENWRRKVHENQKTGCSIVNLFYVFFSVIPKNKYISSGFGNKIFSKFFKS